MKKNLVFSYITVLLCIILLLSCNSSPNNDSSFSNSNSGTFTAEISSLSDIITDVSVLKNYRANIGSSTSAIGLENASSGTRSIDDYLEKLLVKQDEGSDSTEEVTFTVEKETDENGNAVVGFDGNALKAGDVITQGIIPGTIDKVYVAGDYTFISYLTVDTYKLLNYKDLSSGTNGNGQSWYYGNINWNKNSSNNGGTSESINWNFSTENPDCIYINYSINRWWNESDGTSKNTNSSTQENINLRNASSEVQAPGENTGVTVHDTYDYYTSMFRQSFIIDNKTGLIYSVGDMKFGFQRGVAFEDKMGPVEITTNADGTISITELIQNKNSFISHAFKDKYGQYYILNDSVKGQDGNIIFFTTIGEYIPTKEGDALHITSTTTSNNSNPAITSISVVGDNFSERPVTKDDNFDINYKQVYQNNEYYNQKVIYNYNQNNSKKEYWNNFDNGNSHGLRFSFVSLKDGFLTAYSTYYWNFLMVDLSEYTSYYVNLNSSNFFLLPVRDNYLLYGYKNSSDNLYSLKIVDTDSFDITSNAAYAYKFDGTSSSLFEWDWYRIKYSDLVGTTFGFDSSNIPDWDYSISSNYHKAIKESYAYDCDYTFYKMVYVGESFGESSELAAQSTEHSRKGELTYVKNTEGKWTRCKKYIWYETVKTGETFGYDPTMDVDGAFYKKSNKSNGTKYYLEGTLYSYFDADGNLIEKTLNEYDSSIECDHYSSEDGWHYFEDGVLEEDYTYTWYKTSKVAESYGYNPEYAAKGYTYEIGNEGYHVPDYLGDYYYEYYNKVVVGTSFGNFPDSSWDYDPSLTTSGNYHDGTRTEEVYDYDVNYYKYKEGYNDTVVSQIMNNRNSNLEVFDGELILSGVNISDIYSISSYSSAFDCSFVKQDIQGTATYQIVDNGDGTFSAVELSKVVSERKTVTLQPINK